MRHRSSRGGKIVTTAIMEFSRLMRRAAEPAVPGELVTHAINRAAHRLGISRTAARRFWYGQNTTVPAELMDRARDIANEPPVIEANDELKQLRERIARIEALLLADTYRHRPPMHEGR
jgi:hypothetical protein